ncbi:MAG: hypothetical protein R3A47_02340 [Polyangiales bacterium]
MSSRSKKAVDPLDTTDFELLIEPLQAPERAVRVARNAGALSIERSNIEDALAWIAVDSNDPLDALRTSEPDDANGVNVFHRIRIGDTIQTVDLFPFDWDGFGFCKAFSKKWNAPLANVRFCVDLTLTKIPGGGASRFVVDIDNGVPTGFREATDDGATSTLVVDWARLAALSEGLLPFSQLLTSDSRTAGELTPLSYFAGLVAMPLFREHAHKYSGARHQNLALGVHSEAQIRTMMENAHA